MSRPGTTRAWRTAGAVAVITLLLSSASSAHDGYDRHHGRLDLVASAQADEGAPDVLDEAYDATWLSRRHVDADTVATASSLCPGCRGVARTVEVVYVGHARGLHVDNIATAWANCTDCGSAAVSVQVVLTRHAGDIVANNRALAVNAACTGCDTSAAAYQLVVSTRSRPDLRALRDDLVAWAAEQTPGTSALSTLRAAPPGAQTSDLVDLEAVVAAEAPGTVLERSARVQ